MADYDFLCTNLCKNLEAVTGVWAFRDSDLLYSCNKPGFPLPNQQEQKKMFVQAHLMIGMAQTNQQMYGSMNYVSVSFANADCYMFSLHDGVVLTVACVKPYSGEAVGKAVSELVA